MIVSSEHLAEIREQHSLDTIALVHGAFDQITATHERRLYVAQTVANVVVAAIWSDDNITYRKGVRPLHRADERAAMVDELDAVGYSFIVPGGSGWAEDLMQPHIINLKPDVYLASSSHRLFDGKARVTQADGRSTILYQTNTYDINETAPTIIEDIKKLL